MSDGYVVALDAKGAEVSARVSVTVEYDPERSEIRVGDTGWIKATHGGTDLALCVDGKVAATVPMSYGPGDLLTFPRLFTMS